MIRENQFTTAASPPTRRKVQNCRTRLWDLWCSCPAQPVDHRLRETQALRNAAILRIVEGSIGDLQTRNRRLHGWENIPKPRLVNGLGVAQPADVHIDTVGLGQLQG